jgi:hypothetical protein
VNTLRAIDVCLCVHVLLCMGIYVVLCFYATFIFLDRIGMVQNPVIRSKEQ